MRTIKWSTSNAVFVTEIDDEHKGIFEAVADCREIFASGCDLPRIRNATERLANRIHEHFAHEERLMRAARYGSLRWHKQSHDSARRRVKGLILRIERDDREAGTELIEYLTSWLRDHTRRHSGNHLRCMGKLTFRAGTQPAQACDWVTINGEAFEPGARDAGSL